MSQINLAISEWLLYNQEDLASLFGLPDGFNAIVIRDTRIQCKIAIGNNVRYAAVGDFVNVLRWTPRNYGGGDIPAVPIMSIKEDGCTIHQSIEIDSIIRLK